MRLKTLIFMIAGFIGTFIAMLFKNKQLQSKVNTLKQENENLKEEQEATKLSEKMMQEYMNLKDVTAQTQKEETQKAKNEIVKVDTKIEKAKDEEDITISL